MASDKKKGHFTFRTAAVLFVLSAVFELLAIASEVPLFGEIRSGVSAGIYHVAYIALFVALGVGIWNAKPWGYTLVFVATALYTLDKLQLLLSRQAIAAYIKTQMSGFESELLSQGIDEALILQAIVMMSILVVLCWWGFAIYTYLRRDYFTSNGT